MYLHIGQSTVINGKEIVGIYDLDNVTVQKSSREFLAAAEEKGEVKNVATDIPRSFIVCRKNGKRTVYLSQLSQATLLKRTYFANTHNYERAEIT